MRVITGQVEDPRADEGTFQLNAEQEEELVAALEEIRRGNYVDGRELLRELSAVIPA